MEDDAEDDMPVADDALAEGDKWRNLEITKKAVPGNSLCYGEVVENQVGAPMQM
jgi:hypothetical protein